MRVPPFLLALALLGAPLATASAQAATFLGLRWDFSDQQATAYLASLGYVRAARGPTAPSGVPVDVRVFQRAGTQGREAVAYQLRDARLSAVHYTLRAPAAAAEAARRSLAADLDARFGPHRRHPVMRGMLVWNTGTNVVTLRSEAVQGELGLHVVYHAPGSRDVP